ncbi:low molecular weight protein tyrosine phosphatase family protein [Candidatus Viadribacter manganicus]|uniref:low molecular weight protein tyrosine phosphatase family protein n=1 Tax=Candidatus Viadribacter manganicus TaxID=1759059 RepID=UPI000AD4F396|nr:low molecular weight protein tyrosine phosphatase family protein [Candidatus Viadribacter manganicus]
MINALFVCGRNRLRSPTAAEVFASWDDVTTDSAGLNPDAEVPLSLEHLDWANIVFVMERKQATKLRAQFARHTKGKRLVCLDIPDRYGFMQPELVTLLLAKAGPLLR